MRDGAMGGSPYQPLDSQGFATGLAVDPNGASHQGSAKEQLATLLHRTDWVRFALAGNLRWVGNAGDRHRVGKLLYG